MKSKKVIKFTITILSLTASLIFSAVMSEKIDAANESKTSSAVNCEKTFGGNAPESCEQIVYSVDRPNTFGFYRFDEVEVGQTYIVSVRHKQSTFAPQIINPADELTDVNFTSEEN